MQDFRGGMCYQAVFAQQTAMLAEPQWASQSSTSVNKTTSAQTFCAEAQESTHEKLWLTNAIVQAVH